MPEELFYYVRVNPKIQSEAKAIRLRDFLQELGYFAIVESEPVEEAYR